MVKEPHLQRAAGPGLKDGPAVKLSSVAGETQILHPKSQVAAANTAQRFRAGTDVVTQQLLRASPEHQDSGCLLDALTVPGQQWQGSYSRSAKDIT